MNWISRNNYHYIANTTIFIMFENNLYVVVKDSKELQSFKDLETAKRYAENLNR